MKKKYKICIIMAIVINLMPVYAQLKSFKFEQLDSLQQTQKRHSVAFIYTEWCSFCKVMTATTLKNKKVLNILNEKFYYLTLDASEQRTIIFNKSMFKYNPSGYNLGINELAIALGTVNNQLTYPTLCILNYKNEIVFQHSGFLNSEKLMQLLTNLYTTTKTE